MRQFLFFVILLSATWQIQAQHRVTVEDNSKYFESGRFQMDHAIKLKLVPIANGSIGISYEVTLNDRFNMDVGGGYLLDKFNGNGLFANLFDPQPVFLTDGYYLTIGPTININEELLGDYWGIRTSYTFFHQKTLTTNEDYNINRFSAESVMQMSFAEHFFAELTYGVCYQFTNNQDVFDISESPSPFLLLINVSVAYLF